MNDEWTRENQIKEMALNLKLRAVYLSAISIVSVLLIFILGSSAYSDISKLILIPILIITLLLLFLSYTNKKNEIKNIFHAKQDGDNLQLKDNETVFTRPNVIKNLGKKIKPDSQILSNLIIIICILLFGVFLFVVVSLISFNTEVSKFFIAGNLSATDEIQGKGLLSLFNPFIGIFTALALFCLSLIFNTWSGIKNDKKMSEINENVNNLKDKLP